MSAVLVKNRGVLALVGRLINDIVADTLQCTPQLEPPPYDESMVYHVTLLSKPELRSLPQDKVDALKPETQHIHSAGVGGNGEADVFYVVIIWAAGQQLRKKLGLPPKQFHITLSKRDDHDMDKGIDSLFPGQFPSSPSPDFLDHLAFTLHAFGKYSDAQAYSTTLVSLSPDSHRGFLRLADAALLLCSYKLAMLGYACAYQRVDDYKIRSYCMKKLLACSGETEWGHVFQEHEVSQLPEDIKPLLLSPWSSSLRQILSKADAIPSLCLEPRHTLLIPKYNEFYKLPRFFRWLVPYHFAIMSTPRNEDDISALSSPTLGIRHVLTLTEETPLEQTWFRGKRITNSYIPIPNYHPPSIEQMDLIMRLFLDEDKLPILVHCGGGKGRAGTVAACYITACGFKKPSYDQTQPEYSAAKAVNLIRSLRPGSIETAQQEAFVSKWCSTIWKRQCLFPELPNEPLPCPMVIEGCLCKENDLFILVGFPGSGKSWVSKSLLSRDPSHWTCISQDESGSRSVCETEIGRAKGRVILDRCNSSATDRKAWLDLASNWCTSPVCVWFDYDRQLCISRAQSRVGHPTLPPGSRVRNAVDQMSKIFVRPTLQEGFKAIVIIRSFAAAQELVSWLSPPVTVFKFPRTPHLIDLGAVAGDDVCIDIASLGTQGNIVITEKIDGANMGFSLSSDRSQILVQNRSHYVNSKTHEQFKKLGSWVERHSGELFKLLNCDPYYAERYILFGEWVYATHSLPYTRLPDYFIAYDFYDRATFSWASTKTLKNLLEHTSIHSVPILYEGEVIPSDEELKEMVQRPSAFYNGRIEGVYVKVERNSCVVSRGKIVRSDFIAGNEHWTRGTLRVNTLDVDVYSTTI